jgi:replicative DNA helicase
MLTFFAQKSLSRERKEEIDDIYTSTKGLARELNIPVWSASQVNRQGAKTRSLKDIKQRALMTK